MSAASILVTRKACSLPPSTGELAACAVGARRGEWCAGGREGLLMAKSAAELVKAWDDAKEDIGKKESGKYVPSHVAYACGTWTLSLAKQAVGRFNYCVFNASSAQDFVDYVNALNKNNTSATSRWLVVCATAGDGKWVGVLKGDKNIDQLVIKLSNAETVKAFLDAYNANGWKAEHVAFGAGGWLVVQNAAWTGTKQVVATASTPADLRIAVLDAYARGVQSGVSYRIAHLVGGGESEGIVVMMATKDSTKVFEKVVVTHGMSDITSHMSEGYKADPDHMLLRAVAVMGSAQVVCLQTHAVWGGIFPGERYIPRLTVDGLRADLEECALGKPWLGDGEHDRVHMLVSFADPRVPFVDPCKASTQMELASKKRKLAELEATTAKLEATAAELEATAAARADRIASLERELKRAKTEAKSAADSLEEEAKEQMTKFADSISSLSQTERTKRVKQLMREYHPDKKVLLKPLFTKLTAIISDYLTK